MFTQIIIAAMLCGAPAYNQPQTQKDTTITTTTNGDAPKRKINIVIKLPIFV